MHELEISLRHVTCIIDGPAHVYAAEQLDSISLHCWLSHVPENRVHVISSEQLRRASGAAIIVRFALERDDDLPANMQLCFRQYVETANEAKIACRVDAGSAQFLLQRLFANDGAPIERRLLMRTGDSGPLEKGRIVVDRVRVLVDGQIIRRHEEVVAFAAARDDQWFPRDDEFTQSRFATLQRETDVAINRSLSLYYDERSSATRRPLAFEFVAVDGAHCPLYTLDFARLPAAAYLLHLPSRPNDETVYRVSLRAALEVADVRAEHLVRGARVQFATRTRMLASTIRLVDVMANMFGVVTHAMTIYENDFVIESRIGAIAEISENFKEAEEEDGVDCEDSGKMNYKVSTSFERATFAEKTPIDDLLRIYQEICFKRRWYTFGLVMPAIVTNKNLDARAIEGDEVNAHTFEVAQSTYSFQRRIVDFPERGIVGLAAIARASVEFREYERYEESWHADLPFLVLEGTAPSDSLPLPAGAYYERTSSDRFQFIGSAKRIVVERARAQMALVSAGLPAAVQIDASQTTFDYSEAMRRGTADISGFYKIVSTLVVSLSSGTMSFGAFTQHDNDELKAGVSWSELTTFDAESRVRFVPEYVIDGRLRAIIDDALAIAEPIPPLLRSDVRAQALHVADGLSTLTHGLSDLFPVMTIVPNVCASSVLEDDVDVLPLPGALIVLRMRFADIVGDVAAQAQIVRAFAATSSHFSRVRVERFHFADVPVPGETRLHDVRAIYVFAYLATPLS